MKVEYGWIHLVFIPGGCKSAFCLWDILIIREGTGKAQPNDVGVQRVFKHILKTEATAYFIKQTKSQLETNSSKPVKLITDLGPLRDASASWVHKAYLYFKARPELVKQVQFLVILSSNLSHIVRRGLGAVSKPGIYRTKPFQVNRLNAP